MCSCFRCIVAAEWKTRSLSIVFHICKSKHFLRCSSSGGGGNNYEARRKRQHRSMITVFLSKLQSCMSPICLRRIKLPVVECMWPNNANLPRHNFDRSSSMGHCTEEPQKPKLKDCNKDMKWLVKKTVNISFFKLSVGQWNESSKGVTRPCLKTRPMPKELNSALLAVRWTEALGITAICFRLN